MEAPGLSLLQGSESIQINVNRHALEEEEEQEDIKRHQEELGEMLINQLDDFEDSAGSVNSSHCEDSTRENDKTDAMVNSSLQSTPPKHHTAAHLQDKDGASDHVDSSNNCDYNDITNHQQGFEFDDTVPNMQRNFAVLGQAGTPFKTNKSSKTESTSIESPYELARPVNCGFTHEIQDHVEGDCTYNENYPYNYNTPANHYDSRYQRYSNNGYIDGYENNIQYKQIHEFGGGGGGDSISSEHLNHCYKVSPNGRPIDESTAYKNADYDSKEQLEVLYSVRMKEIQCLQEKLQQLQLHKEEETNQFSREIISLQAKVEETNIFKNQAQNAVVYAKAEIMDLQTQMASLKEKNAVLEKTNKNMAEELDVTKNSVIDLQQKITVLERVHALQTSDKTHEKFLKQAQEKHAVEMKNMQTQIDLLTDKLNAKEMSYVALENTLTDVRRAHEALMVEKGDSMNRLAQALEKCQTQCRNLMAANNDQQLIQLQNQNSYLTQEKEKMQQIIEELQSKLEVAKRDVAQYDSLLTTTLEDESDSIRQMKLGEFSNRSKVKPSDDITNRLRNELQRCLAGQTVKRKEITRLENSLAQKEKEHEKALAVADSCQQEAAFYAKRVNELERELKSLLTDEAVKAEVQIQKLSTHLNDVKKQFESLKLEKLELEKKMDKMQDENQKLQKLHKESVNQEKEIIQEYNKEYLEIHAKAVEKVKEEAQIEKVQLSVQLEQTQKELDRVKELYIDVCGTKEQLINEHKREIEMVREKYATLDQYQKYIEKLQYDLQTQTKISEKLIQDCEKYKSNIMDLEKDLSYERKKKEEYTKRIHQEIERAKDKALNELRNAHPNQQISVLLPDHCAEHLQKINQLEEDRTRLEEKLSVTVEEYKKMSECQAQLDEAKLKIAQIEISQESWRKKYENAVSERNNFLMKIATLESKLSEKITHKSQITQLETELSDAKKTINSLESKIKENSEVSMNAKNELEKELTHYKDLVMQLTNRLQSLKDKDADNLILKDRLRQLEKDLQEKNENCIKATEFDRIKEERDQLIVKLEKQTLELEQNIKVQKQLSAELNLSLHSSNDSADFRRRKEIREEMEQRVAEEFKKIEEEHRNRSRELEEKYKKTLSELQAKYNEKVQTVETLLTEKVKIHSTFKAKEQLITQIIESKLEKYRQELVARQIAIEQLQEKIKQNESDVEDERNLMAQIMTKWAAEIREIKAKEVSINEEILSLRKSEENLKSEINLLNENEKELKNNIDTIKQKYQAAKKSANNYKEYAKRKEQFFLSECKRVEDGYKKAMNQVQQKHDTVISDYKEEVRRKLKEIECQYEEKMEQMRLTQEYKN